MKRSTQKQSIPVPERFPGRRLAIVDDSGSTDSNRSYSSKVSRVLGQLPIPIVCFSTTCRYYGEMPFREIDREYGSTLSTQIARFIQKNLRQMRELDELIIITDGEISTTELEETETIIRSLGLEIETLSFYLIRTRVDVNRELSVVKPFISIARNVVLYDADNERAIPIRLVEIPNMDELIDSIACRADFNLNRDAIIASIDRCRIDKKSLDKVVQSLKGLARRLVESDDLADEDIPTAEIIRMWNIVRSSSVDIQREVAELIVRCGTVGSLSFGAYTTSSLASGSASQPVIEPEEVPDDDPYECPLSNWDDIPSIQLLSPEDEGDAISMRGVLNPFEMLIKMRDRLSFNLIGFNTIRAWMQRTVEDPFTRRVIRGVIPLASTPECVAFGNHQIRKALFNSKNIGNPTLVMMVIYSILRERETEPEVCEIIRNHITYRLMSLRSKVSLSGLATRPQYITSMARALQFCIESEVEFRNLLPEQFRMYLEFAIECRRIDESLRDFHIARYSVIERMKWIFKNKTNRGLLEDTMMRCTNRYDEEGNFFVDGEIPESIDVVTFRLLKLLLPSINSTSFESARIPPTQDFLRPIEDGEITPVQNFDRVVNDLPFAICPRTFWSYTQIEGEDSDEAIPRNFGVRHLSLVADYIRMYRELGRKLTVEDMMTTLRRENRTLPSRVLRWVRELTHIYDEMIGERPFEEVYRIIKINRDKRNRVVNER